MSRQNFRMKYKSFLLKSNPAVSKRLNSSTSFESYTNFCHLFESHIIEPNPIFFALYSYYFSKRPHHFLLQTKGQIVSELNKWILLLTSRCLLKVSINYGQYLNKKKPEIDCRVKMQE